MSQLQTGSGSKAGADEKSPGKASDTFIRCLEAEGVEHIFGVPGEENADFVMSLMDSDIEFVLCRYEQSAAFIECTI